MHISENVKHKLALGAVALVVILGTIAIYLKSQNGEEDLGSDLGPGDEGINGFLRGLSSTIGKTITNSGTGGGTGGTTGLTLTPYPERPVISGGGGYVAPTGIGGDGGGGDAGTQSTLVASFATKLTQLINPGTLQGGSGETYDGQRYTYDYSKVSADVSRPAGWGSTSDGRYVPTDIVNYYGIAPAAHEMNPATSFYADAQGYRTNQVATLAALPDGVRYTGEADFNPYITAGATLPSMDATAPRGYTLFQNTPNEIMVVPIQDQSNNNAFTGMWTGNQIGNGNGSGDPNNTN